MNEAPTKLNRVLQAKYEPASQLKTCKQMVEAPTKLNKACKLSIGLQAN